jgi:hypothetical protein
VGNGRGFVPWIFLLQWVELQHVLFQIFAVLLSVSLNGLNVFKAY